MPEVQEPTVDQVDVVEQVDAVDHVNVVDQIDVVEQVDAVDHVNVVDQIDAVDQIDVVDQVNVGDQGPTTSKSEEVDVDRLSKATVQSDSSEASKPPELPTEIWKDIFELLLPPPGETFLSRHEAPMSLTQTCYLWRSIAYQTPQLWTDINILVSQRQGSPPDELAKVFPSLQLIERCIRLSGKLPLSIFISDGPTSDFKIDAKDVSSPLVTFLLKRLFSTSRRWKRLRLSLPDMCFWRLEGYFRTVKSFPVLETLQLTTTYAIPRLPSQTPTEIYLGALVARHYMPRQLWENSPRLRQLEIHHAVRITDRKHEPFRHNPPPMMCWATPASRIPFHQLTVLQFNGGENEAVTIPELLRILRLSPNLVTFQLLQVEISSLPTKTNPIFELPHLRHLCLEVCMYDLEHFDFDDSEPPSLTTILTYFTAPSLTDLTLAWDDRLDLDCFRVFLENSSCSLERLIMNHSLSPGQLIPCLRLVPTLKSFYRSATYSWYSELKLGALAIWDADQAQFDLCPSLEELVVESDDLDLDKERFGDEDDEDETPYSKIPLSDVIKARLDHRGPSNSKPCFTTLKLMGYEGNDHREHIALKALRLPPFNLNLLHCSPMSQIDCSVSAFDYVCTELF